MSHTVFRSCIRQQMIPYSCALTQIRPARPFQATRRYATEPSSSTIEAPDYLDENELKIFDILKSKLSPTKLEVSRIKAQEKN